MGKRSLLSFVLVAALSLAAPAQELGLLQPFHPARTLSLAQIRKQVQEVTVRVMEPHEGRERSYRGFALKELLRKSYGNASGVLIVRCRDGYAPAIRPSVWQRKQAYLVYASADGLPFTIKGGHPAELAPYYLVWENLLDTSVSRTQSNLWPYQVASFELTPEAAYFAALQPSLAGAKVYEQHCLACHTLRARGGTSAPRLDTVSVRHPDAWMKKFLADPQKVMPGIGMPRPHLDAAQTASLLKYLRVMKKP